MKQQTAPRLADSVSNAILFYRATFMMPFGDSWGEGREVVFTPSHVEPHVAVCWRGGWASQTSWGQISSHILPTTPSLWWPFPSNEEQCELLSFCKCNSGVCSRTQSTVKGMKWAKDRGEASVLNSGDCRVHIVFLRQKLHLTQQTIKAILSSYLCPRSMQKALRLAVWRNRKSLFKENA